MTDKEKLILHREWLRESIRYRKKLGGNFCQQEIKDLISDLKITNKKLYEI